jgi:hypothetical protein
LSGRFEEPRQSLKTAGMGATRPPTAAPTMSGIDIMTATDGPFTYPIFGPIFSIFFL